MRVQESSTWPAIYGVAVLFVLGLFLFSLRSVLTPVVLFLALMLLLTPYAGTRSHTLTITAAALLLGVWMLQTTGALFAPFILALVLAYILDPAVDALERRRVPRSLGILLLGLPAVGALLVGAVYGLPALVDQLEQLARQMPVLVERAEGWLRGLRNGLLGLDLPFIRDDIVVERLRAPDPAEVSAFIEARQRALVERGWSAALGVGRGLGMVLTTLGYLVLTPVLTFYLLRDYDRITSKVANLIPERRRASWLSFIGKYNLLLSRYLRGQVLLAAIVGFLTGIGLWITGFPFAGLVGAVAGVFNLVPYLGLIVSLVPAITIAFLSGNVILSLVKVGIVLSIVQVIDSAVLGPRIVGGSVGLHPVIVMLVLALGGFFLGLVGLLLAVPLAVLIKLAAGRAIERYRSARAEPSTDVSTQQA